MPAMAHVVPGSAADEALSEAEEMDRNFVFRQRYLQSDPWEERVARPSKHKAGNLPWDAKVNDSVLTCRWWKNRWRRDRREPGGV